VFGWPAGFSLPRVCGGIGTWFGAPLIGFGFAGGGLSCAPTSPGFVIDGCGCGCTAPGAIGGSGTGAPLFCTGCMAGATVTC
jgi:hypothetical protein